MLVSNLFHSITYTIHNSNVTNENTSPLDSYDPFALTQIPFAILVVTLIISGLVIYYYFSIKKLNADETPKGFALLLFIYINYAKQLVFEILGYRFIKVTPYFLYLFGYIFISNIIGIAGIENPTSSVTVTLSLGLVTFIGTFIVGFKYQRLSFLKRYLIGFSWSISNKESTKKKIYIPICIQPLEIVGAFTPLISISLRLWGNIFAGVIIVALVYAVPLALVGTNPLESNPDFINHPMDSLMLLMSLVAAPINAYLDLLTGIVQAMVFVMLTMVYWKMSMPEDIDEIDGDYLFKHFENDCCVKITKVSKIE